MVRFDTPAFPNLYRTRPLGIRPQTAYYLWFELTAICDDWAMALDGQQFFVQALVDTLPRVAQLHADGEFIQRLVEAARDLRNASPRLRFPIDASPRAPPKNSSSTSHWTVSRTTSPRCAM